MIKYLHVIQWVNSIIINSIRSQLIIFLDPTRNLSILLVWTLSKEVYNHWISEETVFWTNFSERQNPWVLLLNWWFILTKLFLCWFKITESMEKTWCANCIGRPFHWYCEITSLYQPARYIVIYIIYILTCNRVLAL